MLFVVTVVGVDETAGKTRLLTVITMIYEITRMRMEWDG